MEKSTVGLHVSGEGRGEVAIGQSDPVDDSGLQRLGVV
jgi:hypothetical protein